VDQALLMRGRHSLRLNSLPSRPTNCTFTSI